MCSRLQTQQWQAWIIQTARPLCGPGTGIAHLPLLTSPSGCAYHPGVPPICPWQEPAALGQHVERGLLWAGDRAGGELGLRIPGMVVFLPTSASWSVGLATVTDPGFGVYSPVCQEALVRADGCCSLNRPNQDSQDRKHLDQCRTCTYTCTGACPWLRWYSPVCSVGT